MNFLPNRRLSVDQRNKRTYVRVRTPRSFLNEEHVFERREWRGLHYNKKMVRAHKAKVESGSRQPKIRKRLSHRGEIDAGR